MRFLRFVLAGLLVCCGSAFAQGFFDKSRPVKIIVPFAAGGGVDNLARAYARAITEVAGLTVVVDNRPGAEAVIGVQAFMASAPDGYTMLVTSSSAVSLGPVTIANIPFDPLKDFVPLTTLGRTPFVLNLGPSTPFKTVREFVAAARANPGKYTCASVSTSTRMNCEMFQAAAGVKTLIVPYKGAGPAMTALTSGEVDSYIVDPGSIRGQWAGGKIRPLAITNTARSPSMQQLPTLREEGLQDYEFNAWFAAYMPAKTPAEAVAGMRDILSKAMRTKTIQDFFANASIEPMEMAGADLTNYNRREIERWQKLIRTANIKFD